MDRLGLCALPWYSRLRPGTLYLLSPTNQRSRVVRVAALILHPRIEMLFIFEA